MTKDTLKREGVESPEHFVTVISALADDREMWDKKGYKKAVEYARSWWNEANALGQQEERKLHVKIYRWILGYTDFTICPDNARYCWRTELREKLPKGIEAAIRTPEEGSHE